MEVRSSFSIWVLLLILCSCTSQQIMAQPAPWQQIIGTKAPEWSLDRWVNSKPLSVQDLKGKVVLVRWWLETCPYCRATAPSLNEFHEKYAKKGLVIIGMYHPKPYGRRVSREEVTRYSEVKDFKFPIAIDEEWATLKRYWFDQGGEAFTSVSFIIDREGLIRYIHPGGSYNAEGLPHNDPQWRHDYHDVKAMLELLLEK